MKRFSIFLIIVALIISMAGCGSGGGGGNGDQSYILTIAYTLTIDSTAGGIVAVNNSTMLGKATFIFGAGTVVSLNATPDSGYQFVKWTGDVDTVGNVHASQIIVTLNGNYSIMANFEVPPLIQYSLAILSTPGGSVTTPGKGTHIYDEGTVVNLVATPARGYRFYKWSGDVDTIANVNATSTNITMYGDYYICANFREERTCG
jgi:hypothetical protein